MSHSSGEVWPTARYSRLFNTNSDFVVCAVARNANISSNTRQVAIRVCMLRLSQCPSDLPQRALRGGMDIRGVARPEPRFSGSTWLNWRRFKFEMGKERALILRRIVRRVHVAIAGYRTPGNCLDQFSVNNGPSSLH